MTKKELKDIILKTLEKEGGAAGLKALAKASKTSKNKLKKDLDNMSGVKQHQDGDYISTPINEAETYVGSSMGASLFCSKCPCGCSDVIQDYQPAGGGDATYAKCKSPCTNQDTTSGAAKIVDPRYRNPMSKKPTRLREAEEAIIEMINEKLCKKGKAYIAKRKRAGEKSSAYLSGRAVKVCKGQMKG